MFNMSKFNQKMSCWENRSQCSKHLTFNAKNTECHEDFENTENSQWKKRKSSSDCHFWLQESNVSVLSQNQNQKHLQKNLLKDLTKNLYSISQLNHQIWQQWISFNKSKMRAWDLKNFKKIQNQNHLHVRWFLNNDMSLEWWKWD